MVWPFKATETNTGWEVWYTDGTPNGTFLVCDLVPGAGSSFPEDLIECKGRVFFPSANASERRGVVLDRNNRVPFSERSVWAAYRLVRQLTVQNGNVPVLGTRLTIEGNGPSGSLGLMFLGPTALPSPMVPGLTDGAACDWANVLQPGTAFTIFTTQSTSISLPVFDPESSGPDGRLGQSSGVVVRSDSDADRASIQRSSTRIRKRSPVLNLRSSARSMTVGRAPVGPLRPLCGILENARNPFVLGRSAI